jgi:hypothetical protein
MQQASGRQRHIAALLLMAGTLPVGLLWCIQWFAW